MARECLRDGKSADDYRKAVLRIDKTLDPYIDAAWQKAQQEKGQQKLLDMEKEIPAPGADNRPLNWGRCEVGALVERDGQLYLVTSRCSSGSELFVRNVRTGEFGYVPVLKTRIIANNYKPTDRTFRELAGQGYSPPQTEAEWRSLQALDNKPVAEGGLTSGEISALVHMTPGLDVLTSSRPAQTNDSRWHRKAEAFGEPREVTGWGETLVVAAFVAGGVGYLLVLYGVESLLRSFLNWQPDWRHSLFLWLLLHVAGAVIVGTLCGSALRRHLTGQLQKPARAATLGLFTGFLMVFVLQVGIEVCILAGVEHYQGGDQNGVPVVSLLLLAVAGASGWAGWYMWKQIDAGRAVPENLRQAMKGAESIRDALIEHRGAILHVRKLDDDVARITNGAAAALQRATDEAQAAVEGPRNM